MLSWWSFFQRRERFTLLKALDRSIEQACMVFLCLGLFGLDFQECMCSASMRAICSDPALLLQPKKCGMDLLRLSWDVSLLWSIVSYNFAMQGDSVMGL